MVNEYGNWQYTTVTWHNHVIPSKRKYNFMTKWHQNLISDNTMLESCKGWEVNLPSDNTVDFSSFARFKRSVILVNVSDYLVQINSFLKRAFKYGLCSQLFSFLDLADDADQTLFNSMLKKQHCLKVILPEVKTSSPHLRQKGHMFDLPRCTLEIHKRSFLPWCLFKFI